MIPDYPHRDALSAPPGCTCEVSAEPRFVPSGAPGGRHARSKLIQFLDKRPFDFSTLVGASELDVVLCPAIDVLDYTRVKLAVRVHSLDMTSGQMLRFYVWGTLPSCEDPAQDFVDVTPFSTVDITASTIAPALVTGRATHDPDAFLKISLRATQISGVMVPLRATLSACLQLRDS